MYHRSLLNRACGVGLAFILCACSPSGGTNTPTSVAVSTAVQATSAPQPTSVPPTVAPAPTNVAATQPAGVADTGAAVQVVIDYYSALAQKQYDQAYGLWAQNGASSGQSRAEFEQGYANTAGISVLLDSATAGDGSVTVPITILAVENQADQSQKPQRFAGTYALRQEAGNWRIAGAQIAADASAEPPAGVGDALQVLQNYYAAINSRNYPRAYSYWENNGAASKQSYMAFAQGFAETDRVSVTVGKAQTGGAAGSTYSDIPVVVIAEQRDGSRHSFCGTYTLRRVNVPPFDTFGWRIYNASILQLENVQLDDATIQRLLAGQCAAR